MYLFLLVEAAVFNSQCAHTNFDMYTIGRIAHRLGTNCMPSPYLFIQRMQLARFPYFSDASQSSELAFRYTYRFCPLHIHCPIPCRTREIQVNEAIKTASICGRPFSLSQPYESIRRLRGSIRFAHIKLDECRTKRLKKIFSLGWLMASSNVAIARSFFFFICCCCCCCFLSCHL